jgi:hypothetical protein
VPLADERGVVPGLLQILRKENGAWRDRVDVVDDPMPMGILASENRRAARRAQSRRDERIPHLHAAFRKRVEVRRLNPRMPHVTECVVPQIVDKDEDDVAWLRAGRALKRQRALRARSDTVGGAHQQQRGDTQYS